MHHRFKHQISAMSNLMHTLCYGIEHASNWSCQRQRINMAILNPLAWTHATDIAALSPFFILFQWWTIKIKIKEHLSPLSLSILTFTTLNTLCLKHFHLLTYPAVLILN